RTTRTLDEAEGKALLKAAGVAVPRSVRAPTLSALKTGAADLAAPFVLKGLGFAHKTEAGAVRIGLESLDGQSEIPGAVGYLLEEMVTGTVAEVLVGLRRDAVYGVTLTLGLGGVTAEVLSDTVTLVWPVTEAEVLGAMRRLRLWPLLDGYRGRPKADTGAVAAMALALGRLLAARPELEEIEINPVLVLEAGAIAVDALIREAVA
ncbi:MAG: acetate--CoA ligase family protein, partial [Albidovulum sp.]